MAAPGLTPRLTAIQQESETVAVLAGTLRVEAKESMTRGEALDRDTAAFLLASTQSSLSRTRGLVRSYFDLLESEEEAAVAGGLIHKSAVRRLPTDEKRQ